MNKETSDKDNDKAPEPAKPPAPKAPAGGYGKPGDVWSSAPGDVWGKAMGPTEHAALAVGVEMREDVRAEMIRAARLMDDHREWCLQVGIPVAEKEAR